LFLIEVVDTEDIGGEEVRGELDTVKLESKQCSKCFGKYGLPYTGNIFNQEMPFGKKGGKGQYDALLFAIEY
jgi:hypothetical protein